MALSVQFALMMAFKSILSAVTPHLKTKANERKMIWNF
jgi:hypothetical protein